MQLTRYTDLSLRVLIFLALRPGELATIDGIAEAYGVSKAHLMKVVQELGRAGFVETLRGRGGGLRLARAPEDLTVGEVVRYCESPMNLVECFDPTTSECRIDPVCGLRGALEEALEAFLCVLDDRTLASLVARRRRPLAELLQISP